MKPNKLDVGLRRAVFISEKYFEVFTSLNWIGKKGKAVKTVQIKSCVFWVRRKPKIRVKFFEHFFPRLSICKNSVLSARQLNYF